MAEQRAAVEEPPAEDQGNSFSNDGSFMEQFKKMAEQKAKEEQAKREAEKAKINKPLFSRVTKKKPVVMKLGGFRKKLLPGANLDKPLAKAFVVDEKSELNSNQGNSEKGVASHMTGPPPHNALTDVPSEKDVFTDGPPAPKKKKSRFSDGPPPGVMCGSTPGPSGTANAPPTSADPPAVRKRKSRFSDVPPSSDDNLLSNVISSFSGPPAAQTQQSLTETQKQQILEQIEMNKLVAEIKAATQAEAAKQPTGGATYDYDSDEDVEGGTWEHKLRTQEMRKTYEKAREQTITNHGKHHIGDFLPPKELDKFVEKVSALKEGRTPDFSDYKEHKLTEENVGFKMLQNAGWTEGSGLGSNLDGIVDPINKGKASFDQSGVGAEPPAEVVKNDNDFEIYRKRMMLAYRFRPNPLNNPRRPYY